MSRGSARTGPVLAYLSLGSNLGDRFENLRRAAAAVGAGPNLRLLGVSKVYRTEPVEVGPGHPEYLNCALAVECALPPVELLRFCQGVEAALGRDRKGELAPRTVDIDLLLYGEETIAEPDLAVPHRGIVRAFNLRCLADLDPTLEVPGRGRVEELLAVADTSGVREFEAETGVREG